MPDQPLISICIPAYKQVEFLRRLLLSIEKQTFRDFEVIVTDDTPGLMVQEFIASFKSNFNLFYYKNETALGTPENWNEGIRRAKGKWIKMMHDDDWFASENALHCFANAANSTRHSLIFSAYKNVNQTSGKQELHQLTALQKWLLKNSELNLFKANLIGNPSCTLIRKDVGIFYDARLKWVVDFEFYMRLLKKIPGWEYIDQTLINVGIHPQQVTGYTFRRPEVELPENHLLVEKMGTGILKNIFVYDYFWRLYRNLGIRKQSDIVPYYDQPLPIALSRMIEVQKKVPARLLKIGVISKLLMLGSYVFKS